MSWDKKVNEAVALLSDAMEEMTKEELEKYGWSYINPAYERLSNALLKYIHESK